MPDITMCEGEHKIAGEAVTRVCVCRNSCYRFTAESNPWRQSYFMIAPMRMYEGKQVCSEFIENK